jgi:heptosyltransferase-1
MRVLLVKLSSLGDVIHNAPVVSDLARAIPGIEIDWVTEAPYAGLAALHPGVKRVFPLRLRALKKNWWTPSAWTDFLDDRRALANAYDLILDTQGLLKSALVARAAHGPIAGFSASSVREPMAVRFYDRTLEVARDQHAVARNRQLAAAAFGYALAEPVDYGLRAPTATTKDGRPYCVLLHATSRADKSWPVADWIALGKTLNARGFGVVLPWGNAAEKRTSEQIAAALNEATVPSALSLTEAATLLAGATGVAGVDTGLSHLAVALGRPTVGIYVSTQPALTGLYGSLQAINLGSGNREQPGAPDVETVVAAMTRWLP